MSRSLPAAWSAAAAAASAAKSYEHRVVVQVEIHDDPQYLWLAFQTARQDPLGLAAWVAQGAFTGSGHHGPFPLLSSIPDLSDNTDLHSMASLSSVISGMEVLNARNEELFAALGAYRVSDIRELAGYDFTDRPMWVHALWVGVDWADRLTWELTVRSLDGYDTESVRFGMSDRVAGGNDLVNSKMTEAEFVGLPPQNANSPKPIVIGGGAGLATPVRETVVFTDRDGLPAGGGVIATLRPNDGAPWIPGDRVTLGSGSDLVASVAGVDDADTVLTLDAGITRDALHGEGDLDTSEQGYHVKDFPGSAEQRYCFGDPDFPHALGLVRHRPPGSDDLFALPSFCGAPSDLADGTFTLAQMPRSAGLLTPVWVNGTDEAGVAAADVFEVLAATKMGLSSSQYDIEAGAGTELMQGMRGGWTSRLQLIQAIELSSRSKIFWDGSQLKLRRRKTAAEAVAAGAVRTLTVDDFGERGGTHLQVQDIPAGVRTEGFIGRYRLRPGRSPDEADSYQATREKGVLASGRQQLFWLPWVRATSVGDAVIDFWYELLGRMDSGRWPRYLQGLQLDWSHLDLEPEDILALEVEDAEGNAFDGLGSGNSTLWRVVKRHVTWPQSRQTGRVALTLLEVHA